MFSLLIAFCIAAAFSIAGAMAATDESCGGQPDVGDVAVQCVSGSPCMPPAVEPLPVKAASTLPAVLTVVALARDARAPDTAPPKVSFG